ncbi:DinI-like family protein [Symbiopectobacterium sp. RP]
MRVELTLAKSAPLPAGALEALTHELTQRVHRYYPDIAKRLNFDYII